MPVRSLPFQDQRLTDTEIAEISEDFKAFVEPIIKSNKKFEFLSSFDFFPSEYMTIDYKRNVGMMTPIVLLCNATVKKFKSVMYCLHNAEWEKRLKINQRIITAMGKCGRLFEHKYSGFILLTDSKCLNIRLNSRKGFRLNSNNRIQTYHLKSLLCFIIPNHVDESRPFLLAAINTHILSLTIYTETLNLLRKYDPQIAQQYLTSICECYYDLMMRMSYFDINLLNDSVFDSMTGSMLHQLQNDYRFQELETKKSKSALIRFAVKVAIDTAKATMKNDWVQDYKEFERSINYRYGNILKEIVSFTEDRLNYNINSSIGIYLKYLNMLINHGWTLVSQLPYNVSAFNGKSYFVFRKDFNIVPKHFRHDIGIYTIDPDILSKHSGASRIIGSFSIKTMYFCLLCNSSGRGVYVYIPDTHHPNVSDSHFACLGDLSFDMTNEKLFEQDLIELDTLYETINYTSSYTSMGCHELLELFCSTCKPLNYNGILNSDSEKRSTYEPIEIVMQSSDEHNEESHSVEESSVSNQEIITASVQI